MSPHDEILGNFPPTPRTTVFVTAFTDGPRQYGYVEGRNLVIEFRFPQGDEEQYPQLVRELFQANVELVVITGTSYIRLDNCPYRALSQWVDRASTRRHDHRNGQRIAMS